MDSVAAVVEWCAQHDVRSARVHTTRAALLSALDAAGVATVAPDPDAVLWLDDAASVRPRPRLFPDDEHGPQHVVIQGSLGGPGVVPVEVAVDRVSLVSVDSGGARRVDLSNAGPMVREIDPWPLAELDQALAQRGFQLSRRTVDWYGGAWTEATPCHLSWFRNVGLEPGH